MLFLCVFKSNLYSQFSKAVRNPDIFPKFQAFFLLPSATHLCLLSNVYQEHSMSKIELFGISLMNFLHTDSFSSKKASWFQKVHVKILSTFLLSLNGKPH